MKKVESIFEIIGPIMIGPSSSHTAGAVRIGRIAREILGEKPIRAIILFHGSFAETYRGHGSDKAVVGGILGFSTDDLRIRKALEIAEKEGLKIEFKTVDLGEEYHPNTIKIVLEGSSGLKIWIVGSSIGGGNIIVTEVNGFEADISGDYHALIAIHDDKPGMVAKITSILAKHKINIARMKVSRIRRGALAFSSLEVDQEIPKEIVKEVEKIEGVKLVRALKPI
ncbi:MAG: L-serine ammonia-lyase, iron-sulfur-dependent subunit beta [Candidatus Baldrarchaeia archaeon]